MKIPFGIAQTSKGVPYNEIVARRFIFPRMREFEQMEMQFFVKPGTENGWVQPWKEALSIACTALSFPDGKHPPDHLKSWRTTPTPPATSSSVPFGFRNWGIRRVPTSTWATRNSRAKLTCFVPTLNQNYVPYVVRDLDRA